MPILDTVVHTQTDRPPWPFIVKYYYYYYFIGAGGVMEKQCDRRLHWASDAAIPGHGTPPQKQHRHTWQCLQVSPTDLSGGTILISTDLP